MYINPNLCWDASKSMHDFRELVKNLKINDEKLKEIIAESQEVQEVKKEIKTVDKVVDNEDANYESDNLVDISA